jgi:hypothetical protein
MRIFFFSFFSYTLIANVCLCLKVFSFPHPTTLSLSCLISSFISHSLSYSLHSLLCFLITIINYILRCEKIRKNRVDRRKRENENEYEGERESKKSESQVYSDPASPHPPSTLKFFVSSSIERRVHVFEITFNSLHCEEVNKRVSERE